jgi:ubiquitin-large subunit ribosomal protein L40e
MLTVFILLLLMLVNIEAFANSAMMNGVIGARFPTKLAASVLVKGFDVQSRAFERIARLRGGMNLRVKTLAGKTITVTAEKNDSIESLKSKIATEAGIPLQQQRLLLSGKQLDNTKTVGDYEELENDSVLHLVLRLRGGVDL